MLQIFRSVVDDPVARAAPAPADIIDRPSSIVAPNLRTTIPLNRNGDVNQQPLRRTAGSSRSLCSAQPRPMRLGLPARPPRARVRAASMSNADRRRRGQRTKGLNGVGRVGKGNVSASPKGRPRKDDATPGRDAREGIERGAAVRLCQTPNRAPPARCPTATSDMKYFSGAR
jgi:hypothetical protein